MCNGASTTCRRNKPLQLVEIVTVQALNHGHKVLEHLFIRVLVAQTIC